MKKILAVICSVCFLLMENAANAQQDSAFLSELPTTPTLEECITYALQHHPLLNSSLYDQEITEHQIKSKLSAWYPQLNATGIYQNNIQLQQNVLGSTVIKMGTFNQSYLQLGMTQNIFNKDLMLATKTQKTTMLQAEQNTQQQGINIVTNVSAAYYDIMVTQRQIQVLQQDTARLNRNYRDAKNQYVAGTVDKTDYQRAQISLNNSNAQIKSLQFGMRGKYENLKQLMGYAGATQFDIEYDSAKTEGAIYTDTSVAVNYQDRIEYKQFESQKKLAEFNVRYAKWAYIPTISLYGNYNMNYINDEFRHLYGNNRPQSYLGLQALFPIFQGGKRRQDIKVAQLQLKQIDWQEENLRNTVNSEYSQAMAAYRGDLNTANALKENVELAQGVYNIINLQYRSGIKMYLDVITAQSDLRSAQINYTNALLQVLIDKVNLNKALGLINPYAYGMPNANLSAKYKIARTNN